MKQFPASLRRFGLILFLVLFLSAPGIARAGVTITRTSGPILYSDIGNGLSGAYVAYSISTDSTITDAWAQLGNLSGPNISLATYEPGSYHIGSMSAGSTKMAYFYLATASVGSGSESHTVSVYNGKPGTGSLLGFSSFSLTQQNTIQANSNKVSSVITGPNPATLGGIITITVTGDTGTTGGTMAFTAATDPNWPASAYKLYKSVINLPDGSTLTDAPYVTSYSGISGTYVANYSFTAQNTVTAPSATNATGYIQSGQQLKHTQTGGYAGYPPPPAVSGTTGNAVVLSKFSNAVSLTPGVGGTVTYTLRLTNTGSSDVTIDDFVDTLPTAPAAASYVAGSSSFNGIAYADPVVSGSQLTWSGSFLIPAGTSRDLTFRSVIPGTAGTYTNSAVAHIGSVQIDSTLATTDDAPATTSLTVTAAAVLTKTFAPTVIGVGQQSTLTFTITNGSGNPAQSGLGFSDTLPSGLTPVGTATSPQCGGTVSYSGNVINFSGGTLAAGTASCTVTANVTGSTGTYSNTATNIGNLAGGLTAPGISASLQVSAPTLSDAFNPGTVNTNQVSYLTFTIANGAGSPAQTGLGFTETLPSGLAVASSGSPIVSSSCGGTVYKYGTTSALAGGETSFVFSNGSIASGTASCTVTVAVIPTTATLTTYTNSTANVTGLSSGMVNSIGSSATLTVVGTPTLEKAFNPSTIGAGQLSVLTFTINNPSSVSQSKLAFTDLFPQGMVVATPVTISFGTGCSGTFYKMGTTVALSGGEQGFDFSSGTIGAATSCKITMNVTTPAPGSYVNNNSNIYNVSGLSNSVSANTALTTVGTTLSKSFGDSFIMTGSNTALTFTVTNGSGNPSQSGFGFSDSLPSGLTLYGTPVSGNCVPSGSVGCCSGTLGYSGNVITFSGGTLSAGTGSCLVTTYVTGSAGSYTNAYPANIGNLTGYLNGSSVTASLTVYPLPSIAISKTATPSNSAPPGGVITYTYTIANGGGPATNVTPGDVLGPYSTLVIGTGGASTFTVQDGTPSSGLSAGTPLYSTDGKNWSSTAPSGGGVTYWQLPMTGTMNGMQSGGSAPNFSITFKATVN